MFLFIRKSKMETRQKQKCCATDDSFQIYDFDKSFGND